MRNTCLTIRRCHYIIVFETERTFHSRAFFSESQYMKKFWLWLCCRLNLSTILSASKIYSSHIVSYTWVLQLLHYTYLIFMKEKTFTTFKIFEKYSCFWNPYIKNIENVRSEPMSETCVSFLAQHSIGDPAQKCLCWCPLDYYNFTYYLRRTLAMATSRPPTPPHTQRRILYTLHQMLHTQQAQATFTRVHFIQPVTMWIHSSTLTIRGQTSHTAPPGSTRWTSLTTIIP